jgi:hypothetical protein
MNTRLVLKHTFFALALGALFCTSPASAQTTETSTISTRLASLAKSVVHARKEVLQTRKDILQVFARLEASRSTATAGGPVIGNNTPNTSYESIDFYDGRTASPVMQHNVDGLTLALRVMESGKMAQEKVLKFTFEGRSADQKEADTLVLKTCLDLFLRAADKQSTFFIQVNPDPKLGIMCATN